MILTKIEIEAFGGLRNYSLELGKGFHYLYGENEAGKSTICAFLSAMLYGFPKGKTAGGDERRLYMPWGETKMGGTLYFSCAGKDYILKRQFGRTARSDKCSLILAEDWQEVPVAPENIGEHFLGVGQEAFRKTIYISQLGAAFEKGREDEILTKLSNLEQAGDEEISLQKALRELEKAQLELVSKTGRGGALAQLEAEIEERKEELSLAQQRRLSFRLLLEEIQALTKECTLLAEQKTELLSQKEAARIYEQFAEREEKRAARKKTEDKLAEVRNNHELLCNALSEAQKQGEAWQSAAELGTATLVELAKKEAAMQAAALEAEACDALRRETEALTQTLADFEETKKGATGTGMQIAGIITVLLAVGLGFFVSPLCFLMLLLGFGLIGFSFKGFGRQKEEDAQRERLLLQLKEKEERLAIFRQKNPKKLCEDLEQEIEAVLRKAGVDSVAALSEKIEQASKQKVHIEALQKDIKSEETNLAELMEKLQGMEILPEEEPICYNGPTKDMLEKALEELQKRQIEAEKLLAQKQALYENGFSGQKSVALIEEELASAREKREELAFSYEAVTLAKDLLLACAEELKGNFAPVLNEKTGAIIQKLTEGRYSEARVSDSYTMLLKIQGENEIVDSAFVSGGTCDLIYFALRLALLKTLFEKPPLLIMDDTFIQLDAKRQAAAFRLLTEETDTQSLYFSCHEPMFDKARCAYRIL